MKSERASSTSLLKTLKQKVNALLLAEAKLSASERERQQWQLLFQIKGMGNVIVGKGGVNTCFYVIDGGERVLLLPQDLLNKIDVWIAMNSSVTYSVVGANGKSIQRGLSRPEALGVKADVGYYICEVQDGKRKKTHKRVKALKGNSWKPIKIKSSS